jgi:hypothetical protein
MTLNDRLLKIDALCGSAHTLQNQIATRDAAAFPLPLHLESKVAGAIANLTEVRDALNDLAQGNDAN